MLAMLTTLLVAFAMTVDPSDYLSERRALFRELEIAARKMESLSRSSVHMPIPVFPGSSYYLFDTKGNVLGSAAISEELISAYEKTRERSAPTITFRRGVLVVGPKKLTLHGGTFELYLTKEMQTLVQWRLKQVLSRQWHLVIIALGVSFLLCLMLSRYLVVPIRRLQRAAKAFGKR